MNIRKRMERKIIETEDGSHTLYVAQLDEHYHSIHGAIQESEHVFIKSGFDVLIKRPELTILEIGFGTGLNAWLTWQKAKQTGQKIHFVSIEKYPLQPAEYEKLNFAAKLETGAQNSFQQMHQCSWNKPVLIDTDFQLTKYETDLQNLMLTYLFDLVYFDAFAPDKQPDLWTDRIFRNLYQHMNLDGILVTYSAKGQVRRNLQAAGFVVERLSGPPGKREMLRATKKG